MEALKVAIADDNENMLKVLGQVIGQEQDLSVVGTATNGEDTFHIIQEKEPDVVLLDIIMPQIDGLTVMEKCIRIRRYERHRHLLLSVLSDGTV